MKLSNDIDQVMTDRRRVSCPVGQRLSAEAQCMCSWGSGTSAPPGRRQWRTYRSTADPWSACRHPLRSSADAA